MIQRNRFLPLPRARFIQGPLGPRPILAGLLIGLTISACGGEEAFTSPGGQQQPPAPTVASVAVTPSTATLVSLGETVQLSASAQDASGNTISGKTFTWTTSDAGVATVDASTGLVTAVDNGEVVITATADGISGKAMIAVADPVGVGPNGNTILAADGAVTLVFPAGAVDEAITVTVDAAASLPNPAMRLLPGAAFNFGPEGTQFNAPVALTIAYDPADVPAGTQQSSLRLFRLVDAEWVQVSGSTVDVESQTVTGEINSFSVYGVLLVPIATVTITPESAEMLKGATVQLEATLQDLDGSVLTGRELTWSSSDEAVATVDATGLVRSVAEGTATITATSEGQNGSATITVIVLSASISIQTPLQNERFVVGEAVSFAAVVETDLPVDASNIEWSSSLDGQLGNGLTLVTTGLSLGTHTITASVFGSQEEISVRVFTDLWTLYQAAPAQGEIERILGDFNFIYVDGQGVDESWAPYDNFHFDQESQDPSKIVAVAKLDILRHQSFSEPLPITPSNTTGYDYVRSHVQTIRLRLDCGFNTGGGGTVSLSRNFSVWIGGPAGTAADPDACKSPFDNSSLVPYTGALQLLVHEARHSDPADTGHTVCDDGFSGDAELENGSGFAWAALYMMWVYRYSLYDPAFIRNFGFGKNLAIQLLGQICTPPTHSNPLVQALLDELLGA